LNLLGDLVPDAELLVLMQSTQGKEEPDLMALNKEGTLFIFELKAWASERENLLQVLRYGQIFGGSSYHDLDTLFKNRTAASQSLKVAHNAKFGIELPDEKFNQNQVFVVMTNGMDSDTREAIQYWRRNLDVRPWIYRVYKGYAADEMLLEIRPFRVEDDPYEDLVSGFYLLNTSYGNNPDDDKEMLEEQKASAFFDPWKFQIGRLQKGDVVFLYGNGVGIVAYGKANGTLVKSSYHGGTDPEDTYSMKLNQFKLVSPPLTAAEIKRINGSNFPFLRTMSALDPESGDKIIKEIAGRSFAPDLQTSVAGATMPPAIAVPDNSSGNNIIVAMKKALHQEGKHPLSSFTVGCLTGELYDVSIGMVIPVTIKLVSQQKFEEDLKQFADLLKCMKLPLTLIFAVGGTLELPSWFRELCAALGISIIILESELQVPVEMSKLNPYHNNHWVEE
jgi:hypothetical protein